MNACARLVVANFGFRTKCTVTPQKRFLKPLFLVRSAPDQSADELDSFERAAIQEVVDIYREAQALAEDQTRAELLQYLSSENTSSTTAPAHNQALESFWVEQGLSRSQAESLTRQVLGLEHKFSTEQLSASLQRWRRVLPDVDVVELVYKDCQLLLADVTAAVRNIVELVTFMPNKDVISMIRKQPRLLWCEDLPERLARVVQKLVQIHPSQQLTVVADLVEDNPELLYRMDYYMSASQLDDLPIEIQNMMVLGDHGIGFLYRYYRNQNRDYSSTDSDIYEP